MQNRYTGDIGDFGKLGLLRFLHSAGLSIGVNWYLVPDETHNGDGRHVQYLNDERFRKCDESLWFELKHIVDSEKRAVSALENERILDARFFSVPLVFSAQSRSEREKARKKWHGKALDTLKGLDVVFVDPDNGIIVPSALGTMKENKYVKPEELVSYFEQGSSIIYYQHKARRPDSFYLDQHRELLERMRSSRAFGLGLKFVKTSQRYYFFIVQPSHRELITECIEDMLLSPWKNSFSICSF